MRSRLLCFNTSVVRQEREAKKQRERNMYLVFFICSDSRKETSSCRSHEPIINQKPIKKKAMQPPNSYSYSITSVRISRSTQQ